MVFGGMRVNLMLDRASIDRFQAAELDDIDAYIATLDEREWMALAVADAALDSAIAAHRLRESESMSEGHVPDPETA